MTKYRELYDAHADYVSRRDDNSFEHRQIQLEVERFKIPILCSLIPENFHYDSAMEVGCATGELVAKFPPKSAGGHLKRVGLDVSPLNIQTAKSRFDFVDFSCEDIVDTARSADVVILSDVLEHVPDDLGLLKAAADRARLVLINVPLEDNWLNRRREYGIDDESGHLRRYCLHDALWLIERARLSIVRSARVWSHETDYDVDRRALRQSCLGASFTGTAPMRLLKTCLHALARRIPALGRRLYPSNFFASLVRD